MPELTPVAVNCSNCGQQFTANIRTMINVADDPQAKALLLSGRLNVEPCPNCGTPNQVAASILYHDPDKELLIAHVPMELNLQKDQQERIIGNMMNALPKDNFKGYMFSPRRALTIQNLVEQVLEADGVTREMMNQQKERVQLAQRMLETPPADLPAFVEQHDAEIDEEFIQTMSMLAQRMLEDGQVEVAQRVIAVQNRIVELSSIGQELLQQQEAQAEIIQEVANAIEALGEGADREAFFGLAKRYADDDQRLQALIGMARPAFDYQFLQEMTAKIGAAPAAERDLLEGLRDRIRELTEAIDQQSQAAMQGAASFLQAVVNHPNPEELLRANAHAIDDTFMAVLSANIRHAEQQKDVASSGKLRNIYETVVRILQENMQPELRFINELLSTDNDDEARKMIQAQAKQFGDPLLEVMDAVEEVLTEQGNDDLKKRLDNLRKEVANTLA